MKIDWNEAPDWAIGHGLVVMGAIKQVWYGEQAYTILGDSRSYCYGGGDGETRHNHMPNAIQFKTPRPSPWTGEGLPPVGAVCEFYERRTVVEWRECRVVGHDGMFAVLSYEGNYLGRTLNGLRAIRTPEQIAADKREKGIQEMREAAGSLNSFPFDQLYDAGYRKQEAL